VSIALIALAGATILALGLIVSGVAIVVLRALSLNRKLGRLNETPLRDRVAVASAKIAQAKAQIDALPELLTRARAALERLTDARTQVTETVGAVGAAFKLMRAVISGPKRS
jgi:hypothetical protein